MELAIQSLPYLWQGLLVTLAVSGLTVTSSLILGVLLGTLVCYGPVPIRWLIHAYSDIIRGIPGFGLEGSEYRRPHWINVWKWSREAAALATRGQRAPRFRR